MGLLLSVIAFVAIVTAIGIARTSDDEVHEFMREPKRVPDPSPRDIHAITGTLGSAPVPSWG